MLGINVHVVILRHVAVPHTHIWTEESRHCSRFHQYIDLIQEIESHLAEAPAPLLRAEIRASYACHSRPHGQFTRFSGCTHLHLKQMVSEAAYLTMI